MVFVTIAPRGTRPHRRLVPAHIGDLVDGMDRTAGPDG